MGSKSSGKGALTPSGLHYLVVLINLVVPFPEATSSRARATHFTGTGFGIAEIRE